MCSRGQKGLIRNRVRPAIIGLTPSYFLLELDRLSGLEVRGFQNERSLHIPCPRLDQRRSQFLLFVSFVRIHQHNRLIFLTGRAGNLRRT